MAGLKDTMTIDVVAQDAVGQSVLIMVEERPWGSDPDQAMQLRQKIDAYAAFIQGGLTQHYPETAGRCVIVQLDCPEAPVGEIATIVGQAKTQLLGLGIGFRVNVWR